ncbi:MAG: sigma-54-dependent transcriptional regulator [Blastocatellales bacterium]
MQHHILIADDDRLIRMTLEAGLSLNGFQVSLARCGREAIAAAHEQPFDAVISDIFMPDGDGLEVLRELRASHPDLPIILMTAQGELDITVQAVAEGASDVIAKPFEISAISDLLKRLLNARRESQSSLLTGDESLSAKFSNSGLIGRSSAMVNVYKLIARAAKTDATVLITGESGTGKELTARAIHQFSERKNAPFIAVNCSGLTDTLLESELFGHTKGSFTGANTDREGFFEAAEGGTLFLDELASTSPAFQASLLRVLQSGEVRRVGSTQNRRVNVRVIGASNAPLRLLAENRSFRPDLFYRLSVLTIDLPPLRQRAGDIELLAQHFLRRARIEGLPPFRLSSEANAALCAYQFPGNVRELENALTRSTALCVNGLITLDCLPSHMIEDSATQSALSENDHAGAAIAADWPTMEELQRRYLQLALEKVHGNRQHAADLLGIARRTVQRLIARYDLPLPGADESDELADAANNESDDDQEEKY